MALPVAMAVDLGGTHVRVAAVRSDGEVILHRREATDAARGPAAVIDLIALLVDWAIEAWSDAGRAEARPVVLGVAAPGPLLPDSGLVVVAPNLPGWDHVPLADILRQRSGMPTFVHNDARLAALAEAHVGAGKGFDPLLYLTLSTGIGGGVVSGGALMAGRRGLAGELGHVIVRDGGPACAQGHRGCLEGLASGTAIAARARSQLEEVGPLDRWAAFGSAPGTLTAETVSRAARAGDELASRLLAEVAHDLGAGLGSFINAFDPQRIVLGGGVSAAWDLLRPIAMATASRIVLAWDERDLSVVTAALGDHAGLVGAGRYALMRSGQL